LKVRGNLWSVFSTLSSRAQVKRLKVFALELLEVYGLRNPKLKLLSHGYNTIFRVDAENQKFAFRLGVNSLRSLENVKAELAWLRALTRDTDLIVPKPIASNNGALVVSQELEGVPRAIHCVLFEWLSGSDVLEDQLSSDLVERFGRTTAQLHNHASSFKLLADCKLFEMRKVIFTEKNSLWDNTHPQWLPKERLEIFKEVYARVQEVLDQVYSSDTPPMILHADLHEGNFKQNRQRLTIFDFDDCALGYPVQDFAVTFYALSNENDYQENREAFKRGYSSLRPWLLEYDSVIEALIAARSLVLANDVLQSLNPEWHDIAPRFFERSEKRLRNYLRSGQSTLN
jgi:Ser/Thr protein kinase RdoA (MazF antagonist)